MMIPLRLPIDPNVAPIFAGIQQRLTLNLSAMRTALELAGGIFIDANENEMKMAQRALAGIAPSLKKSTPSFAIEQ